MRGRATTRVVLPALAVLLLIGVVAIAATGSTPHGSGRARTPSDSLLDALFTLWIIAAVAGGALLIYGLAQRKAIAQQIASGRFRRTSLGTWLVFVAVLTVIVWAGRALNLRGNAPGAVEEEPAFSGRGRVPGPPDRTPTNYEPGISWVAVGAVTALVVAAVAAYVLSQRRSRAGVAAHEDLAEQLALALDDVLDDLRAEKDPRRAIVAAYARMERILAAGGVPRRSAETADEYLPRVLRELAPDSDAVARLTNLFTQAKFSHHDIDTAMKEEAIEALEQVRDELRARREEPAEIGIRSSQAATP